MTRSLRFPALLLAAAFIATACGGGGGGSSPAASEPGASASASASAATSGEAGSINVLSLWGGSEEEAFKKVLEDFTAKTGWGVNYEADRQTYSTTLQSRITGGNPPDIAIIPGIGFLRRFAKDGSINVLSLWGGSEEEAFKKVLEDFTAKTGWGVNYEADRQTYSTTLQSRITGGNPPDIAIIPGIGFLRRFAKDGSLKKIADLGVDTAGLTSNYPEGFLAAGTVDGELYALPAKYNNKGTMWYRPDVYKDASVTAPKTWDEFKAALDKTKDKPGAMSLGAKDDWNLTDWFESIYIRQAGVDAYDKLFSAEGDWADPSVQKTVDTMLEVINDNYVVGGVQAAVGRAWTDAIAQVFKPEPEAGTFYEGGFVGGIATGQTNKDLKIGETIDWYPFPSIDNTEDVTTFGGDVVGALTDSEGAKAFVTYLITPEANTVWASTGAIVSPHKGVGTDSYPNELVVREADSLKNAAQIRYDGSDLLPAGIQGEQMGQLLQRAIAGDTVDWADFQTRVKAAWDNE